MNKVNDIEEGYVSFENAKLLESVSFDNPCRSYYSLSLTSQKHEVDGYSGSFGWESGELSVTPDYNTNTILKKYHDFENWAAYSRPTIYLTINWIFKNYKIWIDVRHRVKNGLTCFNPYINNDSIQESFFNDYDSPQEAYQAAIKYVLEELV